MSPADRDEPLRGAECDLPIATRHFSPSVLVFYAVRDRISPYLRASDYARCPLALQGRARDDPPT